MFNNSSPATWRGHVCGLYYSVPFQQGSFKTYQKTYLPQVDVQAHATILDTTARTVLTQTFVNPSAEKGIREVRYTFPLYEGVCVVGFTCHVGERVVVGEVKEREKAKTVFNAAIARGETAGLLEQLPNAADVFTTTVGNIPPAARAIIKITYLGELKHDMEVDGIRYTIPTFICPRYGSYPADLRMTSATNAVGGGISITVDVETADGSVIRKIQSPTHPISITMGTTAVAPDADPTMTRASAGLTLGTAQLDQDFVVQIIAKNTGVPKAVLENHLTIPNHRALMTTLVPKFALPPEKPELIFICDRSGSMGGTRITLVMHALRVFLKSLPVGVKFNICSFGSSYSFLWERSVTYSQRTLDEAVRHVDSFTANYGGTEMLTPLKATIDRRYKDMPLDILMLTDGEVWNQQALFSYLNESVTTSKAPIRVFTLGIGNGVSHALIEGVAKAGNGFSQAVAEEEKMDTKVVRMLKGALSPHINDYTLDVKYSEPTTSLDDDDGFEMVEKVADSLRVTLDLTEHEDRRAKMKPISLFDTAADPDQDEPPSYDDSGENRYAHLPCVAVPKVIQAPQTIPPLFAINRTTIYLLLGPEAPQSVPKSIVLRGTSTHGPLELEIPIKVLDGPGETIHQLAAKKAISELEQGRGWLPEAKDGSGELIKTKFEGRFDDMVEREAVRLGVQFQVGGKWCSFVAVESKQQSRSELGEHDRDWECLEDGASNSVPPFNDVNRHILLAQAHTQARVQAQHLSNIAQQQAQMQSQALGQQTNFSPLPQQSAPGSLFGNSSQSMTTSPTPPHSTFSSFSSYAPSKSPGSDASIFQHSAPSIPPPAPRSSAPPGPSQAFPSPGYQPFQANHQPRPALQDYNMQLMLLEQQNKKRLLMARQEHANSGAIPPPPPPPPPAQPSFGSNQDAQALQDYQMQSMILNQDSKKRNVTLPQNMAFGQSHAPPSPPPMPAAAAPASGPPQPFGFGQSNAYHPTHSTNQGPYQPPMMSHDATCGDNDVLENFDFQNFLNAPGQYASNGADSNREAGAEKVKVSKGRKSQDIFGSASPVSQGAPQVPGSAAPAFGGASPFSNASSGFGQASVFASTAPAFGGAAPAFGGTAPAFGGAALAFGTTASRPGGSTQLFGNAAPAPPRNFPPSSAPVSIPPQSHLGAPDAGIANPFVMAKTPEDLTHLLISLQTFKGSWEISQPLLSALQTTEESLGQQAMQCGSDEKVFVTALVVAVFEYKLKEFEGSWELVVEKGKGWLGEQGVEDVEGLVLRARGVVKVMAGFSEGP